MKKVILIFTLFVATIIHAQDSEKYKNEIGVNLFQYSNALVFTSEDDYFFMYTNQIQFLNGLTYRRLLGQNVLRVAGSYQFSNLPDFEWGKDNYNSEEFYNGNIWNVEVRMGYEKQFGNGKFQPLVAMDAFYSYGENNGSPSWYFNPAIDFAYFPEKYISQSVGLSASLGVLYQFTERFSARIETSGKFGWYSQKTKTFWAWNNTDEIGLESGSLLMYNPITVLTIGFKF